MNYKLGAIIAGVVAAVLLLGVSFNRNRPHEPVRQAANSHTGYPSIHTQSVNIDEAYDIYGQRMIQEKQSVDAHKFPVAEKLRRMHAVRDVGEEMLSKLEKSHFKDRFDKKAFEEDIQRHIVKK